MKKSTMVLVIIGVLLCSILAGGALAVNLLGAEVFPNQPNEKLVLFEKSYFNTRMDEKTAVHTISTGCKISYRPKYKKQVAKCIETATEEINAKLGEYFRQYEVGEVAKEGFCEQAEGDIKDIVNELFNEELSNQNGIEYIDNVVLYQFVYQ